MDNVRQGLCNILSLAERTAQLGSGFYNSLGLRGPGQTSDQAAQMWGNAAGLACNRPPQDIPSQTMPPFTGGQCPGDSYIANVQSATYIRFGQPVTEGPFGNGIGPGPLTFESGPTFQRIRSAAGGILANFDISNIPDATELVSVDFNVRRQDGQPDTCGDPPGITPEYDPNDFTITPTINYDDADGIPRTFSPTILYKPIRVSPNGQFSVPIQITFEDNSNSFGDFNLTTGDITIGGGNGAGDGVSGPDRELDEDEEPGEDETLVGVRVRSTISSISTARVTELFSSGGGPNLYVPRVASVLFERESANGLGWSDPIDVKTLDAVIYSEGEAVRYVVIPRNGVAVSSNPIVRPSCPPCGG